MAQQVFPQWSPVVKAHNENQQEVYIPAAIIHAQTRDGKDELIVGAANMQKDDATGLYLPTNKDFPLEARVRHLEALIGKLDESKETDPDAASATLLALLRGLLTGLNTVVGTVDNGAAKVTLTGSKTRISSAPVVGVRTITSIAAELHAGASRKVGRTLLMVRNLDPAVRVRVGPSTVSDRTGFGIEPEAVLTLAIDPGSDVPIYAVSEAGAVQVEVLEA